MCLLVNQPRTTIFDDEFLTGVYSRNQDGLGIMYAEDGKMHIFKCLPANSKDFIDFYNKHAAGRECVWHARMQTHGDVDMDNCHPYKVTDRIWMAHNGVLSASNDIDTKRSDTWHFINFLLRPALQADPDLLLDDQWIKYVGKLIGNSNKFAFVRDDGVVCVINESVGVTHQGAWLSNTYAWGSMERGGYTNMYTRHAWGYHTDDFGWEESLSPTKGSSKSKQQRLMPKVALTSAQVSPMIKAAYNQWTRQGIRGVEQWVFDAPHKATAVLSYWYEEVEEIEDMVDYDPEGAAMWIAELFQTDSIQPSMLD
jgi:hypothetical protein